MGIYSEMKVINNIETIYLGGGTPSILFPGYIAEILNSVYKYFDICTDAEITIEVNPGSVDDQKLAIYRSCGINRISVGVQSFIERDLVFLKRIHNVRDTENTLNLILKYGFENFSMDLIFSIPGSSMNDLEYNMNKIIEFNPQHISAYSLIFEEGTGLYIKWKNGEIEKVSEKDEAEMYLYIMQFFEENGYNHYEISNYARKGYECKHNINYWNHTDYLGIGPSSHSYIKRKRWWNFRDIRKYFSLIDRNIVPVEGSENIVDDTLLSEIILLGLRSTGIDLKKVEEDFHIDFYHKNQLIIKDLIENGFIYLDYPILLLTKKGFLVCDEICRKLM